MWLQVFEISRLLGAIKYATAILSKAYGVNTMNTSIKKVTTKALKFTATTRKHTVNAFTDSDTAAASWAIAVEDYIKLGICPSQLNGEWRPAFEAAAMFDMNTQDIKAYFDKTKASSYKLSNGKSKADQGTKIRDRIRNAKRKLGKAYPAMDKVEKIVKDRAPRMVAFKAGPAKKKVDKKLSDAEKHAERLVNTLKAAYADREYYATQKDTLSVQLALNIGREIDILKAGSTVIAEEIAKLES